MSAAQRDAGQRWGYVPPQISASGKTLLRPWSTAELAEIRALLQGANYRGQLPEMAVRMGRTYAALQVKVSLVRRAMIAAGDAVADGLKRPRPSLMERNGAEGGPDVVGVAHVPRVAPSAAAPGSGHDVRQDVSSLDLASAVRDPRPVSPAAGAARVVAPAGSLAEEAPAPVSPGLCWARERMARGIPLAKVLSSGGDRLTWRDRDFLRPGFSAGGGAAMTRRPLPLHSKAVRLAVRLAEGETIGLAVRLVFAPDGAVLRVLVPVGDGALDPRDQAARRLVQRLDAEMARPGAPGLAALRREAELLLDLAEQLEALEEQHGPAMARTLRLGAA